MGSLFGRGFDSLQLHEVEMNAESSLSAFCFVTKQRERRSLPRFALDSVRAGTPSSSTLTRRRSALAELWRVFIYIELKLSLFRKKNQTKFPGRKEKLVYYQRNIGAIILSNEFSRLEKTMLECLEIISFAVQKGLRIFYG